MKLFLTCWPDGRLRPVEVLGDNNFIPGGTYIRYMDGRGGTDTTTSDFLYDVPVELIEKIRSDAISEVQDKISQMSEVCGEGSLRKENIDKLLNKLKLTHE